MMFRAAMILGFAIIVVSTFLTWSDNPPFSESGLDRTAGLFALVAAAGAGVIAVLDRRPRGAIIAVSAAALVLIATVVDLLDISSGSGSAGMGIWLALAAAAFAFSTSGVYTFSLFKKPG